MVCLQTMYGLPYKMVDVRAHRATVVVRALSAPDARRRAVRECRRALGDREWRIASETIVPCLVSLGGRPRLYEGRFVVSSSRAGSPIS